MDGHHPKKEPRGKELIDRYCRNYNIANTSEITEKMVLGHWTLGWQLTKKFLGKEL
jgi:hypothetical protein